MHKSRGQLKNSRVVGVRSGRRVSKSSGDHKDSGNTENAESQTLQTTEGGMWWTRDYRPWSLQFLGAAKL
jgi:hypothetical protein